MSHGGGADGGSWKLVLGALGVVYGDIGTSPLYAMKECFGGEHGVAPTEGHVFGVLSLVTWTLILLVTVKYLLVVLRADNHGEGGILALLALVQQKVGTEGAVGGSAVALGLFGSALLYGDGVITPAISVLSAVEGFEYAFPGFHPLILPVTMGILIALFAVQRGGTAAIGAFFGPVMVAWFATLALLGLGSLARAPHVLQALAPWHGVTFLWEGGFHAFTVLGSVFLCATGGEALYADMGHFGAGPIRRAWFVGVLPALLLNYYGQGALLLSGPVEHPFYELAPSWALVPLVVLASAATVIASQALISGVFSLTRQAVQLGYLPRVPILHTSATESGQIYIGVVNWTLLGACLALVLGFRSSSALAAAYGIAVAITMVITTVLIALHARSSWGWGNGKLAAALAGFLALELAFLGANSLKIANGGWFPLALGFALFVVFTTWKRGRALLGKRMEEISLDEAELEQLLRTAPPIRVPRTAVYLSASPHRLPLALTRNLEHNQVMHEQIVFLTIETTPTPTVRPDQRANARRDAHGIWRVTGRYGFMETPDVPDVLHKCVVHGLTVDTDKVTYFLGRETVLPSSLPGMAIWREALFAFLTQNAQRATTWYRLPPTQVVELGSQIEI